MRDDSGVTDGRQTVNILQAAARCQVSRRTIYNWLRDNKVEWARTAGGSVRIFEDSLFRQGSPRRPGCRV